MQKGIWTEARHENAHGCVKRSRAMPDSCYVIWGTAPGARWLQKCARAHTTQHLTALRAEAGGRVFFLAVGVQKGKENMSYTKFVAALVRANSGNVNKIRISPGRCRSTVASTKTQEDKDQLDGCAVVETVPVELISQTKNSTNTQLNKIHIDFDNTQEAYRSKGNIELLRSLLVFKLCTIDVLVEKNKEVS